MNHNERRVNSPSATASVTENTRQWFIAVIMATSILVNIWLVYQYRDFRTQEWLKDNNLQFFETNQFADLRMKVAVQEQFINSLSIKKACTKEN
jgi:hypothetical protein